MTYASTSIDRRADYYARSAPLIAADPLDFYTRAENGRRFQMSRLCLRASTPKSVAPTVPTPAECYSWRNDAKLHSVRKNGPELVLCGGTMAA